MTATATAATAEMTANILATWERASATTREQGAQWYGEAREAARHDQRPENPRVRCQHHR